MRAKTHISINALIGCFVLLLFASCSGNRSQENKTASTDTTAKPKWVDPQRGKIYGKVNVVQIPLTAIEDHIFGPVKSVSYKSYNISGKDGTKTLADSGYNVYDKFGHLVDQNEYKADGTPKWKCSYKYDDQNKAVEWDFNLSYADKYSDKITFKYDNKGNKIEEDGVSTNRKYSGKTVYEYDDKGNEIEEAMYDGDGKAGWVTAYKYDDRNFQVEMTMRGDGRLIRKTTQDYDNNGDKTGGIFYSSDTVISGKWTATLDNKGRTTETIYYKKDGKIAGTTKQKYDDWDNITEYMNYKPDGSIDTAGWNYYTEYEYDSKGNPTKETDYKLISGKKTPTEYTATEYTYY